MQGGFKFSVLERGLFGNQERSGKAAEDCRSPRRYREVLKRFVLRQFLDCGNPLPLCGLTHGETFCFPSPNRAK